MFVLCHVNFRKSVLNHVNFKSVFFKKAYGTSPAIARQWRVMTGWVGVINNCVRCGETSQRSSYNCNTSVSYDSIVWIIINTFIICIIPRLSDSKICFFMPINENIMIEWSKYTRIQYLFLIFNQGFCR